MVAKFWIRPVRLETRGGFSCMEPAEAQSVAVTEDSLIVDLVDGRTISVPLAWYPRLANGSPEERAEWEFIGRAWNPLAQTR